MKRLLNQAETLDVNQEYLTALLFLMAKPSSSFEKNARVKKSLNWLRSLPQAVAKEICFEVIRRDRLGHYA